MGRWQPWSGEWCSTVGESAAETKRIWISDLSSRVGEGESVPRPKNARNCRMAQRAWFSASRRLEPLLRGRAAREQSGRQTQTDKQAGRQTDRQTDKEADRQTGRQADRQTDRQTETAK